MKKDLVERIKTEFKDNSDLILKEFKISPKKNVYVFFLETISGSDKVNDYILKTLSFLSINNLKIKNLASSLPSPNTIELKNEDEIEFYLTNGFAVIFADFNKEIVAVEVKADLDRSISTPDSQPAVNGPKDAFTENYQKNLGLIKRRIKSHNLNSKDLQMGRKTNTKVGILYFKDIADKKIVDIVYSKLKSVDVDGVLDISYLIQYLRKETKSFFPTIKTAERPDIVVEALLEGKIVIIMDTSPYALILPAFFADFVNPIVDNYGNNVNVNTIKLLRLVCFFLTIMTPALYIALVNYNQETIPTSLMINFSTQRELVPFPTVVECLIMLFVVEILRESDLRFPSAYGSSISILGALIIGESAVSAGLFSPIMIIIVAITLLSSMIFNDLEMIGAIRHYRLIFILGAAIFGLLGFVLAFVFLIINMTSIKTFGKPYMYPLAPFDRTYFNKSIFRTTRRKDQKRSPIITKINSTKQGGN